MWKKIKGFENYSVDESGVVINEKSIVMVAQDNGKGYLYVQLTKGKKRFKKYVHRLVAEAFVENPRRLNEINHKNENKADNRASNLEWCTHKENCLHGTRIERAGEKHRKMVVCVESKKVYLSLKEAAADVGVRMTAIANCLNGRSKTSAGYHWRYADV